MVDKKDTCDRCGKKITFWTGNCKRNNKLYCGFICAYFKKDKDKNKPEMSEQRKNSMIAIIVGVAVGQLGWWLILNPVASLITSIFGVSWGLTASIISSIVFTIMTIGAVSLALASGTAIRKTAYGK